MISRRNLLYLFLAGGFVLPRGFAYAEDGHDSSKDDGGGHHDGSGDDGGGHNDGSGDDGGGHDDGSGDYGGDDDGGSDNEGDDTGGSEIDREGEDDDQDRALDAVRNDHAASLKEILSIVRKVHDGDIVHVSLSGSSPNLTYHIRLLDSGDRLIEIQIDALSRQVVHIEGT